MFGSTATAEDRNARLRAALNQPLRGEPAVQRQSVTELLDLSSLGGRWFQSEHGPGYVIESRYEAGHAHGDVILRRALGIDPARLAGQDRCRARAAGSRLHERAPPRNGFR